MKRALIWVWILALLAGAVPAAAEESRAPGLFDLYVSGTLGDRWIASAVPLEDGTLLASWAPLPEDRSRLYASDGVNRWEVRAAIPDEEGLTAVLLYDPGETRPRSRGYSLMPADAVVKASSCVVRSRGADGQESETAVLDAAPFEWLDLGCHLLTLAGDVPPGSPVLTADGELAGIIAAGYGGGKNRMIALTTEEISRAIYSAGARTALLPEWSEAPEGLAVRLDGNEAVIDWSGAALPEKAEGETLYLVMADAGNNYFSYLPVESWTHSARFLLTPGRVYLAGMAASRDEPEALPDRFTVFVPGPAEWLTQYGFRPTVTAVAELPTAAMAGTAPIPVTEVTETLLRSGRAYFYSSSTYRTDGIPGDERTKPLLVTLTDPYGINYRYETVWTYDPSAADEDTWYFSLQQSGLTDFLDRNGYPAGVYQLDYYIGGELADAVTFELK